MLDVRCEDVNYTAAADVSVNDLISTIPSENQPQRLILEIFTHGHCRMFADQTKESGSLYNTNSICFKLSQFYLAIQTATSLVWLTVLAGFHLSNI